MINNEENFNKMIKENEAFKKEINQLLSVINANNKSSTNINEINSKKRKDSVQNFEKLPSLIETSTPCLEYLKNVLLKYLEAIALGNEFQIKLLENVIFTILRVSPIEKELLEEKRIKSSFYYNLWYNAKSYIAGRIYGTGHTLDNNTNVTEELEIKIDK